MGKATPPPAAAKAVVTRVTGSATKSSSSKCLRIPRAADLTVDQLAKRVPTKKRVPTTAPIEVTLCKYTSDAGDKVSDFAGRGSLWQFQVRHDAYPTSIVRDVMAMLNDFLSELHADNDSWPRNVADMRARMNTIRPRVTAKCGTE